MFRLADRLTARSAGNSGQMPVETDLAACRENWPKSKRRLRGRNSVQFMNRPGQAAGPILSLFKDTAGLRPSGRLDLRKAVGST